MNALLGILANLLDANTLGGWVRTGVAAALGLLIAHNSSLATIFTPEVQTSLGAVAATIVVGVWSTIAKAYAGK